MEKLEAQDIKQRARALSPQIIETRRELHRIPERGYHEQKTAAYVAERLRRLGLDVQEEVTGTGVVGLLRGHLDGPTVAVRADIDALPVDEMNEVPYKSTHEHRMHACGHDGHMAVLLGLAALASDRRETIPGNIKFIFQPAEECLPDGGAEAMIDHGVLEDPRPVAVFGLHMWPDLPAGSIGVRKGPIMAAADIFEIDIRGQAGHGAAPHQAIDALVVAAEVILGLQTVVSRGVDPLEPAVVSVGTCSAGTVFNVVAEEVQLSGTTRYFDPDLGDFIPDRIERIIHGICQAHGASYDLRYNWGYPPTINDDDMTSLLADSAAQVLGAEHVEWISAPSMTGEDFARYLQEVPGSFFWLGTRNEAKGIVHPLHSSHFQIDEDVLSLGTAVLANAVLDVLYQVQ